jgi:hypothetical protein
VTALRLDVRGVALITEQAQHGVYVGYMLFQGGPAVVDLLHLAGQFGSLGDQGGYDMGFGHARRIVGAEIFDQLS